MATRSTPSKKTDLPAKRNARQAFDTNIVDAELLFNIDRMLQNDRQRRMRTERRQKVGVL